ncbi:MAG TPA: AMP-binding protein [Nocardioidaceae bacterium]|nr:AMP-binding protein [Nocardioidaceae bacterium]
MDDETARRRDSLERAWVHWRPRTLSELFDVVVERFADDPFVLVDGSTLTYREVRRWSRRIARGLIDLGVHPGDKVALLCDNRPELVAMKLAVSRIGAVAVPLNFSYRGAELTSALRHAQASMLVTIGKSLATDFLAVLDEVAPNWERTVGSADVPSLRQVVLVDPGRPGAMTLEDVADRADNVSDAALDRVSSQVDPDGACDIVFTSGTSGLPVAAELTHDMVLRSGYGSAYHRAFAPGWRVCFSLPLYHVFGYIEGLVASMFAGGAIVPRQIFNPDTMLRAVEQHGANELLLVPTMSVAVVERAAQHHYDLSSLESVFSAAAPAPVWLWERVQRDLGPRTVFTGYGQTEVSAATTLTMPGDPLDVVAETVGCTKLGGLAAPPGMSGRLAEYRTVDPFDGSELPPGAAGELAARGPIVTRSYHGDPDRTAALITDGWLRTGDLGRVDDAGYLRLTGRARELYKCGGELVAPKEVEDLLTAHPGVAQAYVAGVPDERMGEVGWAWVVPDGEVDLDPVALVRYCRERLAPFKAPRRVALVAADDLPKTPTGKVQKFRLVESAR